MGRRIGSQEKMYPVWIDGEVKHIGLKAAHDLMPSKIIVKDAIRKRFVTNARAYSGEELAKANAKSLSYGRYENHVTKDKIKEQNKALNIHQLMTPRRAA